MNYTKSGIIANGAPNSIIRMLNEINNALDKDLTLLLLTDEGRSAAKKFSQVEGFAWEEMPDESKAEMLSKPDAWKFFSGVVWGLNKNN